MNKQIEDMAKVLCNNCAGKESPCTVAKSGEMCRVVRREAEALYNAGFRKQREGEWYLEKETYGRMLCSNCREEAPIKHEYNDERKGHLVYVKSSFCSNCGARMRKEDEGK